MDPPKNLCAKCFNTFKTETIACHVCKAKLHLVCAKIEKSWIELIFNNNKNVVFNCDQCLKGSSDLLVSVSSLSNDVKEVKQQLATTTAVANDVKEIKQKFSELFKDLEKPKNKQKMHFANIGANKRKVGVANQHVNSVVGNSGLLDNHSKDDDASSLTSYPTAASNMYDSDTHQNEWQPARRRKRRNRVIALGSNETDVLDVIVKKKFVHISSFKPTVTVDNIISYIESNTEIGKQHIECTRLTKKDVDVATLKHVNFKVGVTPCFYDDIVKPSLWPTNIKIRPFVFYPRKAMDLGPNSRTSQN